MSGLTSNEKPYVVPAVALKSFVGKHAEVPALTCSLSEKSSLGAGGGGGAGGGAVVAAGGLLVVAGGGLGVAEGIVVVDETTEQASPLRSCLLNLALRPGRPQTAP